MNTPQKADLKDAFSFLASAVELTNYDDCNEALLSRDLHVGHFDPLTAPLREGTLIVSNGAEHAAQRRTAVHFFTRSAVAVFERDIIVPAIEQAIARCVENRGADGKARGDVVELSRIILTRLAGAIVGLDGLEDWDRARALSRIADRIFNGHMARWATVPAEEVFAEGMRAVDDFTREFHAPSEARRMALVDRHLAGDIPRDQLPFDVITMMLLEPRDKWSAELRIRQSHMFLAASIHTTANSVAHTLNEAFKWLDQHPGDRQRQGEFEFLRRVANETLRLHPSSPAVMRRAAADITLKSGMQIPAGSKVAVRLDRANRDAAVFGLDAESFNPMRSPLRKVNPYGLAFGGGVHMCIGKPMVTDIDVDRAPRTEEGFEVQLAMVRLLRGYLGAGATPDPESPPTLAPSGQVRYATFPVIFSSL